MDVLSLVLAVVALAIAILVYRKVGGMADLRKQMDQIASSTDFRGSADSLTAAADALGDKTAEAIGKLEDLVRKEKKEKTPEAEPPSRPKELGRRMPASRKDFQAELNNVFASAQKEAKPFIDVRSGDLHGSVGGYPGRNHRMPLCCGVMKRNMKPGDEIVQQPPSGQGATLIIRFRLPRGRQRL